MNGDSTGGSPTRREPVNPTVGDRVAVLGALHDHARRLSEELPGRPSRVRLRSGDAAVEVEWADGAHDPPARSEGAGHVETASGVEPSAPVVTSPMVGTFYRSPKPGAKPFVDVGDAIEPGDTVGIVEAMKLMNPVVVETAGKVDQILVADGEPVDFGRPLMMLVPAS